MPQNLPPAEVRTTHLYLIETPFEALPALDHGLFAVLALIDDEFTQREIITALGPKLGKTAIIEHLTKAAAKHWISPRTIEGDTEWTLRFLGKNLLEAYLTVMKKGVIIKTT